MPDIDFETRVQRTAENHLNACNEAFFDEESDERPWYGPYDGCDTCVVREVLMSVWDDFRAEARREARVELGLDTPDDWILPGGAVIDDSRVKLRLHPPPDWKRLILEIPRTPPSMNNNEVRSHWSGFHEHKKSWQAEIALMLMAERQLHRGGYRRAIAGAFMRFPGRSVRDSGNFEGLLNKALGDALVIAKDMPKEQRYIPDDDPLHYFFGGVEIEDEPGPQRTQIYLYLQPKEK